ncbi:MAG: hypothetical protein ACOC56_05605 [Atribacterota bacterium]
MLVGLTYLAFKSVSFVGLIKAVIEQNWWYVLLFSFILSIFKAVEDYGVKKEKK